MKARDFALVATAAWAVIGMSTASAQQAAAPQPAAAKAAAPAPKDLTKLEPLPNFNPPKTAWGDPDFRGGWPIDSLGGLPLQRTVEQGNRVYLTDEEYQRREAQMDRSRNAAANETKSNKLGMGNWVEMTGAGRRTSLLIDPPNGRLPELTEYGKKAQAAGRSSWVKGQTFDWPSTDFDSWDRCVTRGFPASMMPFRYNNGIRIFQSPGYVVIALEMIHDTRIIPIGNDVKPWPAPVKSFMGNSRGHWEGNTLVIETDHIRPGAAPLNMATIGAPPNNTIPMSEQAKVVERLTMSDPNTLVYEMTYSDPVVWTAPYTIREDWQRNDDYGMFEYACIEGDVQVFNYIKSSRAERAKQAAAAAGTQQQAAAESAQPAKKN